MFKIVVNSLLLMLLAETSVFASDTFFKPYIGVIAGSAITSVTKISDSTGGVNTDSNPGLLVGLVIGASMDTNLGYNIDRTRLEAEVTYRTNELVKMKDVQGQNAANINGTVSLTNVMLNGYLENANFMTKEMPVSLFLSVGAGVSMASITEISYRGSVLVASGTNTQLSYQGGLGIGSDLAKNVTIDLTYKYMGTTPFKFSGVRTEYGSHNALVGVRYLFN